jgi:RHS repeat-associated protein
MYVATMETSVAAKETALFSNVDETRAEKPVGYPDEKTVEKNAFVAKLNAKAGGKKIGPSLVLKVMAGDTVQINARAFYKSQGPKDNTQKAPVEDMLAGLIQAFGGNGIEDGSHGAVLSNNSTPFNTIFYNNDYQRLKERNDEAVPASRPKAYLNFVLFDDNFKMVESNSGVRQVKGEPDELQELSVDKMVVEKSGFFYVYSSNESQQDVYFDNLTTGLSAGPLLEETHYYPLGLVMTGISSKAAVALANRHKFGGREQQSQEFSDGSGLETYDYGSRMYDNQLGRWYTIDGLAEKYVVYSPYHFVANNPIRYKELDGRYFVDSKGHRVSVSVNKVGHVSVGKNASADLQRMANLVNSSGSQSAVEAFRTLGNNETKINFKIDPGRKEEGLLGLHQAHSDNAQVEWEENKGGTGKFQKMPDYIKGKDGKDKYKEATITIFEGEFTSEMMSFLKRKFGDSQLTKEESMAAVFTHEAFHDTDQETIDAIKQRMDGKENNFDVENAARKNGDEKAIDEIKKKRNSNSK